MAVELAALFAEVDAVEAEARDLREAAEAKADTIRGEARERAARIVAAATERVDAERERALALGRAEVRSEAVTLASAAAREAAEIRAAGAARLPELVAGVLACVERTARFEEGSE